MGRDPRVDDHGGEVYVYRRERIRHASCAAPPCARVSLPAETSFGVRRASNVDRVDRVANRFRRATPNVARYLDDRIVRWRTGSNEGQFLVLAALIGVVTGMTLISLVSYAAVPAGTFVIPVLLGMLGAAIQAAAGARRRSRSCASRATVVKEVSPDRASSPAASARLARSPSSSPSSCSTRVVAAAACPGLLGEAMLVDLRDRLQAQGVVPPLPNGLDRAVGDADRWWREVRRRLPGRQPVRRRVASRDGPGRRVRQGCHRLAPSRCSSPVRWADSSARCRRWGSSQRPTTSCSGRTGTTGSPPRSTS